jgi:phage terminase large subunit
MEVNLHFPVSESHVALWERQNWRYAFLMGGRGNGRSGTASRYAVSRLFGEEYTRGALVRAVHADIEKSCWAEVYGRLEEQGVLEAEGLHVVNGDMIAKYGSNSLSSLGFKSSAGLLTARLKSLAEFNFAWIEEAEEIGEEEFSKLDESLRTTKGRNHIILTLNTPAKSHWIIKRFFDLEPSGVPGFYTPRLKPEYDNAIYIPGTYRDNLPNIDADTAKLYEKYQQSNPPHYFQVIQGLCPETVLGKIYQGWQEIDAVPHEARFLGRGLDFGFDPDPAALLGIYWHNGGFILDEELYQTELTNPHLAASIKGQPSSSAPVIADSAEPKSIAELRAHGLNVIPCEKGPDSVNFGIKHVQGLKVSFTRRSSNLRKEYESYAWLIDKKTGENRGIEDPKCANHLMSAARYGLSMFAGENSMYDPQKADRAQARAEKARRNNVSTAREDAGL